MKTIRIALVGSAVVTGRRCATLSPWISVDLAALKHRLFDDLFWDSRSLWDSGPAIVDVEVDTLEPTDDGDPDEMQLCEQAQATAYLLRRSDP